MAQEFLQAHDWDARLCSGDAEVVANVVDRCVRSWFLKTVMQPGA